MQCTSPLKCYQAHQISSNVLSETLTIYTSSSVFTGLVQWTLVNIFTTVNAWKPFRTAASKPVKENAAGVW